MKNLFILSFIAAFFALEHSANARTQGSYIGLDAIRSHVRFSEVSKTNTPGTDHETTAFVGSDNYGGGISYKYAFNYRGVFIAPGLFAERHDARADGSKTPVGPDWQRLEIKSRYGIKADAGVDIGPVSPYITGGYSGIHYRARNFHSKSTASAGIQNDVAGDWFYGAGFKLEIPRSYVSVNFEYNLNRFSASNIVGTGNTKGFTAKYKTRFDVFKLGLLFNF